jgi:uncharacterized protein (UPF0332 family)
MTYFEYYTFVKNRLKDTDTLHNLAFNMYQELVELGADLGKYDTSNLVLELGDVTFYFVALQTIFEQFISYIDLNLNDVLPNEIYESDSIERIYNGYLMFYSSALIGFVYDYSENKHLLALEELDDNAVETLRNIENGINFYSTVLIELLATFASRYGKTFTEIIELNVDKLVQRDKNDKY